MAGILIGAVVATAVPGTSPASEAYLELPEFQLWRVVMVAQLAIYVTVAAFLLSSSSEAPLPRLSRGEAFGTTALTVLVVLLPNLMVRTGELPLYGQRPRLLIVVAFGLLAVLLVMNQVARVHRGFRAAADLQTHWSLRQSARDLLMVAGLIVTMATLGSGVLQTSVEALERVLPGFDSWLTADHVLGYGAYFTLVLFLFFAPLFVAERRAALRLVPDRAQVPAEVEAKLGLHMSLAEQLVSIFGVLSPLLAALASRLVA